MLARKCISIVPHEVLWIQDWLLGIYAWNNLFKCSNLGISFWYGFSANGNYLLRIHRYAKLICFYSIIFPSWRCFQLRSWVIIFGLHRFDVILVFHKLFFPGNFRITDLALWPDVFIFFFATCAEAMPNQCSSANDIRGYFSQLRKCYSTSVTELLTSFQLIYGK